MSGRFEHSSGLVVSVVSFLSYGKCQNCRNVGISEILVVVEGFVDVVCLAFVWCGRIERLAGG